jgi:class 3 adenylate cyclase
MAETAGTDVEYRESGNRMCSVVFADIVEYSKKLVSQQVALKTRFSALLAAALEHTAAADRLVIDTGDGAAICFWGDPEDALFTANTLRSRVLETREPHVLQLRVGINLGPVRMAKDVNGRTNVLGDGINVAQRVMSFAEPNQILVSRSYYEVVSRLSPEYAQLFHYVGLHRDKHVRQHEVYEVQLSAAVGGRAAAVLPQAGPDPSVSPVHVAGPNGHPDSSTLGRLTTALAGEIGPVAKLVVRKAAERATDVRTLCENLAENVPEPRRAAFLAVVSGLVGAPPKPAKGHGEPKPTGSSEAPGTETPREIGPELLVRAEQMLTRQIGPLARILVRNAAKQVTSPRELFEHLATHIDDVESRKVFMADAERA